jgi:hypothetical protein
MGLFPEAEVEDRLSPWVQDLPGQHIKTQNKKTKERKAIAFMYPNNEHVEFEIKNILSLTLDHKN